MYRPSSFSLGTGSSPGSPSCLLRAEVIRELTVYVSCLSWMPGPGGNSLEFSKEVQSRLTHILDQIINTSPRSSHTATEMRDQGLGGRESLDPSVMGVNDIIFDWDTIMYSDSQLDLFSQSLI